MSVFFIKQPAETRTIGVDYTNKIPIGVTLVSRQVLAARLDVMQTALFASTAVGVSTLQTAADVGNGAILTLEPGTDNEEVVLVQIATGANPCSVTLLNQLSNAHTTGVAVDYYPGASDEVLGITTPIVGNVAQTKVQRGKHGEQYHLMFLVTLSNGDVLEDDIFMHVEDQ